MRTKLISFALLALIGSILVAYGDDRVRTPSDLKVFPVNDLGMHCMDEEYHVLSLLPPFNVLNAQVVFRNPSGLPILLDARDVRVTYDAVADPQGSYNSYSEGKTDFWSHAQALFGIPLLPGQGLLGFYMPLDAPVPGPQDMPYESQHHWFSAVGIPITPWDDNGQMNPYPMLKVTAHDSITGAPLQSTDAVVPVSGETDCSSCHSDPDLFPMNVTAPIGGKSRPAFGPYPNASTRILNLHDHRNGTSLMTSQPVLCAQCHYSLALDLDGSGPTGPAVGMPTMSAAMHKFHGNLTDAMGDPIFPTSGNMAKSCYTCHPGKDTQCLRGPMAAAGMTCFDCHGNMLAVGGNYPLEPGGSMDGTNDGNPRRPWIDLPRCQSCHTGDEVDHLSGPEYKMHTDNLRLSQAYREGDPSASPILATNKRFAENDNTLYRFSKGHGGLMCEACHGSTHAEWPNAKADANDNLTATQLQGHDGPIIECATCHANGTLPLTMNGPHGMHNVNEPAWYDHKHNDFYENNETSCKRCHGLDLLGSPLGRAAAKRTFVVDTDKGNITVVFEKGEEIRCNRCHKMPE